MSNNSTDYNFSYKKKEIKKIFDTPDFQEYKEKKKKKQVRKERIYKITSIGNSTNIVKYLILSNVIIFFASFFIFPNIEVLYNNFALYNFSDPNFRIWQIVTSMFLHGGFLHLLFNMIALWSIGNYLDNFLGNKQVLQAYFIGGLISSLLHASFVSIPAVGASGAICSLLSVMALLSSDTKIYLFFIIPINLKKFVYGFTIFSLVFGILSIINPVFSFGIAHFGHLGGLLTGFILVYYWKKKYNLQTT